MGKKVSLIIPCYNAEPYIDMMLGSVYGQLHDDIELICVDDGSTDNTRAKVEAWKPHVEQRGYSMKILAKENGGAASAINLGLSVFTGDYVCFPDADDMLMPGYVSEMLACLEAYPNEDWVKCNHFYNVTFDTCRILLGSELEGEGEYGNRQYLIERYLTYRTSPVVWVYMVKAAYLRKCLPDLHLEDSWSVQEYQLVLPLALNKPFVFLDKPLYLYMVRNNGFGQRYMKAEYIQTMSYWENQNRLAKTAINKLEASKNDMEKWGLLSDITLNSKRIYYAELLGEEEAKARAVNNQIILLNLVLADKIDEKQNIPLYAIQAMSDCAIDTLINPSYRLRSKADPFLSEICEDIQKEQVFLYGAGQEGRFVLQSLLYSNIRPVAVWDKSADDLKKDLYGVPVLFPGFNKFTEAEKQETIVVIGVRNPHFAKEIIVHLQNNGFSKIVKLEDISKMLRVVMKIQ